MDRVPAPTKPLVGRSCAGCTLCCKVMGVPEINKERGEWCIHCERGSGCRIYASRPTACRTFLCGWLTNPRFGPEWKPDRSRIVINVNRQGNGLEFQCDPGFPEAWRKEPYQGQIRRLAAVAVKNDGIILVRSGRKSIVVSFESEFPLGEIGEDDEVVLDYRGDRMVGARVVKEGKRTLSNSRSTRGE